MRSDVSGPTVMSGTRHGAPVEISIEARESETRVGAETPRFEVKGDDEQLAVTGGAPDGVVVKRRFRGSRHTQWLWMVDLWLAERLAAAARGG